MPSSPDPPDETSRSSGAESAEPALSQQPERLSDEIYDLFSQSDVGRLLGLKSLIRRKWLRDLEQQKKALVYETRAKMPAPDVSAEKSVS